MSTPDEPAVVDGLRVAFAAIDRGDGAAAEAACRGVLALRPQHPDALTMMAIALTLQQRHAEAVPLWSKLTGLAPADSSHWVNLGTALRAIQQLDAALQAYLQAAALGAAGADFQYNVGLLHQDRGDYDHALSLLTEAAAAAPLDAAIQLHYAQCCYELLRVEEAVAALARWQDFERVDADLLGDIALLLLNLGEQAASQAVLQRLLREPRPTPKGLLRFAQIMERTNRTEAARSALLALSGDDRARELGEELQLLEAQVAAREGRHAEAARIFAGLAAACREPHRRHLYLFPLAKAQDALGRHEEAIATLRQAHDAQLTQLRRVHPGLAHVEEPPLLITRHGCDPADRQRWDDDGAPQLADSPVFIVAFPRSGTTLLEHSLDAHPQLVTMDEQPFLQHAIDHMVGLGVDYPAGLAAMTPAQLDDTRRYYWQLVAGKLRLAPGTRLIDKNPLNLLRLPAIHRLFPASRIVLAIRHPFDVILSCYMQHFRAPEFALLCRDLPTLARGYARVFDFWYAQQSIVQAPVIELRYEQFVADFSREVRALADFLQLPWDDAMLEPGEHARRRGWISTPSYSQVIEPVHRRSVDRWKHYATHFHALQPVLAHHATRWGYELG